MTACFSGRAVKRLRELEVPVGVSGVAERPGRDHGQPANVSVGERDRDAVRRKRVEARDRIRGEALLALLAVGDDRRPGRLELRERVADGVVVELVEPGLGEVARGEGGEALEQRRGPRDAADRFGWNGHDALRCRRRPRPSTSRVTRRR